MEMETAKYLFEVPYEDAHCNEGKVFTMRNLDRLVNCINLKDYRSK
jgi:hypothetical protein